MANNRSFETAGTVQGTADLWSVSIRAIQEAIAVFNTHYFGPTLISWDPSEAFERFWFMPMYVHETDDLDHVITTSDASVPGDWISVYDLLEEIGIDFRGHVETVGHVHLSLDSVNSYLASLFCGSRPTTPTEAMDMAAFLKVLMYYEDLNGSHAGHMSLWPAVHRKEDVLNRPVSPDPTDLPSAVTLVNELKAKHNAHILLQAYGDGNENATLYLDDITHADLPAREAGLFRDLGYESFERGWSVPDMATSGKLLPSGQDELIDMDSGGGGTSIWGTGIWGFTIWGSGTVSWPRWHEQFLYSWSLIRSEPSVPSGEIFEKGWKLPGSHTWPTNDKFKERYYDSSVTDLVVVIGATKIIGFATTSTKKGRISVRDASFVPDDLWKTLRVGGGPKNSGDHIIVNVLSSTDVEVLGLVVDEPAVDATVELIEYLSPWRFLQATQLQMGIVESFNAGWKDCEVGAARYWSGTEWRFLTSQIDPNMYGTYLFGSYDLAYSTEYEAPALVDFSRTVALHVTTQFGYKGQFWMQFLDRDGATRACYWFVEEATSQVGKVITDIGLTSIEADPRYPFKTAFNGIKEILDLAPNFSVPLGAGEWRGTHYIAERFEDGWTLTLGI